MSGDFTDAINHAERLRSILDDEFEALSNNRIDAFENLQPIKIELLSLLTVIVQQTADGKAKGSPPAPDWQDFYDHMQSCRDAHLRNEILIRSRLDAIRGTLRILQNSADMDTACQIYDRMGRISDRFGGKRYADA
jgi:flagellar biosynthesis/type III secretory pathway chaperone